MAPEVVYISFSIVACDFRVRIQAFRDHVVYRWEPFLIRKAHSCYRNRNLLHRVGINEIFFIRRLEEDCRSAMSVLSKKF